MTLPFSDEAFDKVSTFGVIVAAEPQRAAAELARVMKPGERLALAGGGQADRWGSLFCNEGAPPRSPFDWGDPTRHATS